MDTVRRRSITLPPLYDDMVAEYAAERGMGFSPALVMMLEMLRSDPRFVKLSPSKPTEKAAPGETVDPLVILANTPFPPAPLPPPGDFVATQEDRDAHWTAIRDIYQARRQLGMKLNDVDYKIYARLEKRAREGML